MCVYLVCSIAVALSVWNVAAAVLYLTGEARVAPGAVTLLYLERSLTLHRQSALLRHLQGDLRDPGERVGEPGSDRVREKGRGGRARVREGQREGERGESR